MTSTVACVLCSIDPNMPSLMLPVAQATILAAPILLRDHVKRGARAVTSRLRETSAEDESPAADDEVAPEDTAPA